MENKASELEQKIFEKADRELEKDLATKIPEYHEIGRSDHYLKIEGSKTNSAVEVRLDYLMLQIKEQLFELRKEENRKMAIREFVLKVDQLQDQISELQQVRPSGEY